MFKRRLPINKKARGRGLFGIWFFDLTLGNARSFFDLSALPRI